ncbi:MAG: hypothetical protein H8E61_10845 [Bacteroidetes bacterium]|nr:hypothetical protein [Bacteroidota bacterium]
MHHIEPYYLWRDYYEAEKDEQSPFFEREYDEFKFTHSIYNYVIHPQWDYIGSDTLFIKILYVDYSDGYAIIEMIGEWNDCINNDIMFLKRDVLDHLIHLQINKFIMIAENVLNFHFDIDDYYAEIYEDVEDGWAAVLNLQEHVEQEFQLHNMHYYLNFGEKLNIINWRVLKPSDLFHEIKRIIHYSLGTSTEINN